MLIECQLRRLRGVFFAPHLLVENREIGVQSAGMNSAQFERFEQAHRGLALSASGVCRGEAKRDLVIRAVCIVGAL